MYVLFDYTAVAVSGKVGIPLTVLTTPVGWLSFPRSTVVSRSLIVVSSKCLVLFCVVTLLLGFFCWCRGFVIGLSQSSSFFS